jgi:hypothetical protein
VDTGNNRVVIVDRSGNQLWPLDAGLDAPIIPFDYYSSPERAVHVGGAQVLAGNSNLNLSQPADASVWVDNLGASHTIIADTGHNRVVEVVSTGALGGAQTHVVNQLTPDFVRPPWDRTQSLKLRYSRAQPIFDADASGNQLLLGYLCTATNIDRVVVVQYGTKAVDPTASAAGSPSTGGTITPNWADWTWLYSLQFSNIRHVEYFRYGSATYVAVAAGGLANTPGGANDTKQDGVWVWQINTTTHAGTLVFSYTAADYAAAGAFSTLVTPSGQAYSRRFYPVCVKVLYPGIGFLPDGTRLGGNVLITNYGTLVEQLARPNVTYTDLAGTHVSAGTELHGEVFEVDPNQATENLKILEGRSIPDPWQADWNDPINQPAYAERY